MQGTAVYAPEKDALVWKIKNFPGGREFLLRCKFGLPSVAAEDEAQGRLPPIKVKFEVRWWGQGRMHLMMRKQAHMQAAYMLGWFYGSWVTVTHLSPNCACWLHAVQIPYYSVRQV